MSLESRFWAKVDKNGPVVRPDLGPCWLWTAMRSFKGYGRINSDGPPSVRTNLQAHRVSWELHVGPIPDGVHVLHKCDNRLCVNPEHLFLGTNLDNVRDKEAKGRANYLDGATLQRRGRQSNNTSGFVGVTWFAHLRKWGAGIGFGGKHRHLGVFSSKEDAARAYDRAAREFYGSDALTNFPANDNNTAHAA